jgi:2-hydroxy-3-keto-5-methylthiopentenyl-1-phosphate phosphatase
MPSLLTTADELLSFATSRVLVTDFDGTMTGVDFFDVVLEHVPVDSMPDYWGRCVAGELTHVEALDSIFQHASRDPAVLATWLPQTKLDPLTPTAVAKLRAAGWSVLVVSAGSQWYIEQILADLGDTVAIIANPGGLRDTGLWMGWPAAESPWYSPHFGVDKARIIQLLRANGRQVAFAGDGRPDLAAMPFVPPEGRFAKAWLAEQLTESGQAFRLFQHWSEIADHLLADPQHTA